MGEEMITTGVDELVAYLRGKDRVAMQDAATVLGIPLETIQAWVDFLVEEKLLGIEYKFTKPYIYLNREAPADEPRAEDRTPTLEGLRAAFVAHARDKRIPDAKIGALWQAHVLDALEYKHAFFIEQAVRRKASEPERLLEEYRKDLLGRCANG